MRKIIIIVLCCTTILLAGYVGLRAYKVWKQRHMMAMAREFAAKSDLRNAALSATQVLTSNPRNLEACRFMAELAEAVRSPDCLLWRSRVVELTPNSAEDCIAWARSAISLGDLISATNALARVPEAGRNRADYHHVAGVIAVASRQLPRAEFHFLQACQLQPTNLATRLSLAVVHLYGTNAPAQEEARCVLRQLSREPATASQAFHELIDDALRNSRTHEAIAMSQELVQQTNSGFGDRLFRLRVLHAARSADFEPALALCQKEAEGDPGKIYQLATWHRTAKGPQNVLLWVESLPAESRTNRAVQLALAECRLQQQDWRGLQAALEPQNWAELEFLRHAFLARALRGQDLTSSAKTEWQLATKTALLAKQTQVMLVQLAVQWNLRSEAEELLWTVVGRYPEEKWAFVSLHQALLAGGRTRSLMALYGEQVRKEPADLEMKNNLAMTALLLDAQELKPHDLAREVYAKAPTNAAYASTYALSLHVLEKDSEALRILQRLPPKELEQPAIAGYYGLILKATGSNDKARAYLDWAAKAQLLPEERKLFAQAKAGLAAAGQ